jgi:hypothetical protein
MSNPIAAAVDTVSSVVTAIRLLTPIIKPVAQYLEGKDVELPELPGTLKSEIEYERLRLRSQR